MKPAAAAPDPALGELAALVAILRKLGGDCLHLKPGSPPRLRIGTELRILPLPPVTPAQTGLLVSILLGPQERELLSSARALETSLHSAPLGRLRLHCQYQRGSIEMFLRPVREVLPTFASLGLPIGLKSLRSLRSGLVLVASPGGGGKSTTLAAMVHQLNRHLAGHILCVDQPTQFVHRPIAALVDQVEVGRDTPSQSAALRAAFRQDLDVVVAEAPSEAEAAELLLHLAETGRLVICSVPARSAAAAVEALAGLVPAAKRPAFRARLERQLEILLLQLLVPRSDGAGKALVSELLLRSQRQAPSMDVQLAALARKGFISWTEAALHAVDRAAIERAFIFDPDLGSGTSTGGPLATARESGEPA